MEKKLLLAVTLSIIVMLGYPLLLAKINPPPVKVGQLEQSTQLIQQREVVSNYAEGIQNKESQAELPSNAIIKTMTTDRYEIYLSNIGGSIQKLNVSNKAGLSIDLIEDAVYDAGILAIEGKGALADLASQQFVINKNTNILSYEANGLKVEKHIRFLKNQYALYASIKITNTSSASKSLNFLLTTGSNISNKEVFESRYIEANILYKGGKFKKIASGNFKKPNMLYQNNIEWISLKNKYYSIIAKPEFIPAGVFTKSVRATGVIGFIVDDERILPGETKNYNLLLYIGPTELSELEKVDKSFRKALNFGIFTGISLVLLSILKFFYGLFNSYGLAILLLTCCISIALFPLTFKSMKSMRKLQEIQPHIEKVREVHKDNPHKLNKAIMDLYREYKVNPMGGCLPMFFQMPIFIALYQTLMRSVELKGVPFLWIKDLSMPDAAFTLPFTLPFLGNAVNILPILMIGAMILQQKMSQVKTTSVQSEQQKIMTMVMPIVFGFIFYSLPAGLVLYWLTNTLLTSSLQFFFLRKA